MATNNANDSCNSILVSDLPSGITEKDLEIYFHTEHHYRGGNVKKIKLQGNSTAIVEFECPKAVKFVLDKCPLLLSDKMIKVEKYSPTAEPSTDLTEDVNEERPIVKVTGIPASLSDEYIQLYFENPSKSGGGDVEKLERYSNGSVLITYTDNQVVEQVLSKSRHELSNTQLTVTKWQKEPQKSIRVTGFERKMNEEILVLFFESEKRSGGGRVESVKFNGESVAMVTFESEEVCQRVLKQTTLQLEGQTLAVSLWQQEDASPKTIVVTGFKADTADEMISLMFENPKKTKGGDIEEFRRIDSQSALITYRDAEVARRVLNFCSSEQVSLKGKCLQVAFWNPEESVKSECSSPTGPKDVDTCTIKVLGVPDHLSKETVSLYFENHRRSGGGEIKDSSVHKSGALLITFHRPEVVDSVLSQKTHTVGGVVLQVSAYRPPAPVPIDPYKVFIKGVKPETTEECLTMYIENITEQERMRIVHGERLDTRMLIFHEAVDLKSFQQACKKKPLEGSFLTVSGVPVSNCVRVTNLNPRTSKDALLYYFESKKRSSGGEVTEVKLFKDEGYALVYFKDNEVLDHVVKRNHAVEGTKLSLTVHYDCLGLVSLDGESPPLVLPGPVNIPMNSHLVQFFLGSGTNRQAFEMQIQTSAARVEWPSSPANSITLHCVLEKVEKNRRMILSWEKDVAREVKEFFRLYHTEEVQCLQETWASIKDALKEFTRNEGILVIPVDQSCTVAIVGHRGMVEQMKQNVQECKKTIEDDIERQKKVITEKKPLKHYQILYLRLVNFPETVIAKVSGQITVKLKIQQNEAEFYGLPSEIERAKLAMYEEMETLKPTQVELSPGIINFMQSSPVKKFLADKMRGKNVKAAWETGDSEVTVFASTDKEIVDGARIIKSSLVETALPIKPESCELLGSTIWRKKVSQIEETYDGLLKIHKSADGKGVDVFTTNDIVKGVLEVINDFLAENTILTELSELDSGTAEFIRRHKQNDVKQIETSLHHSSVSIQINSTGDNSGIQVKGTQKGIDQAKLKLEELAGDVKTKCYHVNKPGYPKYLLSDKGKDFLGTVELKSRVVITEAPKPDSAGLDEDFSVVAKPGSKVKATCGLPNSRKISIVLGDMTEYKVDVIVNAANGQLRHAGGLAGAIVKKGGHSIQKESFAYIEENGDLLDGNVAITGPGNLPCTAIIHAVGPVWKGGNQNEALYLEEAVFQSLTAASKHGFTSIAIPALSTGVFGYPLNEAVTTIVEGIRDYFKEEPASSVRDVTLIDVNDRTVQAFINTLINVFGQSNVHCMEQKPVPTKRNLKWTNNVNLRSAAGSASVSPRGDVVTKSGLKICLVKGELAKQTADVVVNSTSKSLDLNNGAISSSLLRSAGPGIQAEVHTSHPNGLNDYGDVVETQGYQLNCKAVYHGSLQGWEPSSSKPTKIFQKFIQTCLAKAEASRYSSIAFPAIGTGNLRFPDGEVAKLMYEIVKSHSDSNPGSTLKTVSFVVYPASKNTVQAFEAQRSKLTGSSNVSSGRRKNRVFQSPVSEAAAGSHSYVPEMKEGIFPLKQIRFSVYKGDITLASTDAIVNSTNELLDLHSGGGVSAAILKAAGDQLQEDCEAQKDTMKKEGVVVTGSGDLKCKRIIHVDAQRSKSWKKKIILCLEAANNEKLSSITFPAIGTGVQKQPPGKIAEDMFEAINEFQSHLSGALYIKNVHMAIFIDSMVGDITGGLKKCYAKLGEKPKSWWSRFASFLSGGGDDTLNGSEEGVSASPSSAKKKYPKSIALVVISDDQKSIDEAIDKIDSMLKSEVQDRVVSEPWTDTIKQLSDEQIATIVALENEQDIKLSVENRVGRIRIQGMPADVMATFEKVTAILKVKQEEMFEARNSEFVAGMVQWYYLEDTLAYGSSVGKLEKYDPTMNKLLEEAFRAKLPSKTFRDNQGFDYYCDFQTMEEYPTDDPSDRVKLIRKELYSQGSRIEPPTTWETMGDKELVTVDLQSTSSEYQSVQNNLRGLVRNIIKIERIQNVSLYEQFIANKGRMERANPGKSVEKMLWHGTSSDTIASINTYGFNRSYCGKNATAYGNGVYFAVNPSYSAQPTYSRPDSRRYKRMYQSKVLVGDYTQGRQGMNVPPSKSGHILYDSVVDNPSNPSMYIIFHDAQAYPEYLITFT